jgi:negative regulator of replication initiation
MRTIRISEDVWQALVRRGKTGDSMNDILRRVLKIDKSHGGKQAATVKDSSRRMRVRVIDDVLIISFDGGPSKDWQMPLRRDGAGIRKVLQSAAKFAEKQGASRAQVKRIEDTVEQAGYYTKP